MDEAAGEDDLPEGLASFAAAFRVELVAAARRKLGRGEQGHGVGEPSGTTGTAAPSPDGSR